MAALSRTGLTQADIIKMMQGFNEKENEVYWAEHSQFYKQVMSDGNIFNPYLHRRFLPVQFTELIDDFLRYYGSACQIPEEHCYYRMDLRSQLNRVVSTIIKETELLSFLKHKDVLAYDERSMLTPMEDCKQGFLDLLDFITEHCHTRYFSHEEAFWEVVKNMRNEIASSKSYKELFEVATKDRVVETLWAHYHFNMKSITDMVYVSSAPGEQLLTVGGRKLCAIFLKSGAYYTLKHEYMFNDFIEDRADKIKRLYDIAPIADWVDLTNMYLKLRGNKAIIVRQ